MTAIGTSQVQSSRSADMFVAMSKDRSKKWAAATVAACAGPIYLVSHGLWWGLCAALAISLGFVIFALLTGSRQSDAAALQHHNQMIVLRRLKGLPDREP